MAPCLDAADIAYALHSILTMGGTSHDADILEAVLGQSIAPISTLSGTARRPRK